MYIRPAPVAPPAPAVVASPALPDGWRDGWDAKIIVREMKNLIGEYEAPLNAGAIYPEYYKRVLGTNDTAQLTSDGFLRVDTPGIRDSGAGWLRLAPGERCLDERGYSSALAGRPPDFG